MSRENDFRSFLNISCYILSRYSEWLQRAEARSLSNFMSCRSERWVNIRHCIINFTWCYRSHWQPNGLTLTLESWCSSISSIKVDLDRWGLDSGEFDEDLEYFAPLHSFSHHFENDNAGVRPSNIDQNVRGKIIKWELKDNYQSDCSLPLCFLE